MSDLDAITRAAVSFERLTARQVLELPDPPESDLLVGPFLIRGYRTIVVGNPGHGKTTFSMQLLGAAVQGREFLKWEGVGGIRGLVVDLEQGLRSVKRTLAEAHFAGCDDVDVIRVPDGLALDQDDEQLAELERHIIDGEHGVVLLDPFYKAHRAEDSNAERGIGDLMRALDGLRDRHGFALILPAHPRKDLAGRDGARKLTLDDIAGSGVIGRGAEIGLAIERLAHGYARVRILKDRDSDLPVGDAWPLIYSKEHGFRLDPKEEHTAEELERRVADSDSAWRTVKEWASHLGIREGRARQLLGSLVESGAVEPMVGPPGRSPKAHCYRTAPVGWEQSGAVAQSLLHVVTDPTAPDSYRELSEVGAVNGSAATPGAVDPEELERLHAIATEEGLA